MSRPGLSIREVASWLLVAGLFVAPLTLGKMIEARDLWAHLAVCALVAIAAASSLAGGVPLLRWERSDGAIFALLLSHVIAAIFTVYPHGTVRALLSLVDYLAVYLLVRSLLSSRRAFWGGVVAFACSVATCAAIGIREYLTTALSGNPSWRAFGPFYNPNLFAAMLLMGIPLWVALVSVRGLWGLRVASGFALALCWLCFFVTGSKGGALALVGALVAGSIVAPDPAKGSLVRRTLLSFGVIGVICLGALLLPPIRLRLGQAFGAQSNSMMFRYYTWLGTWHMVLDRPLLGFGPGTFGAAYPRFALVGHTSLAHETYLQVAAETGFVGLAALLAAVGTQLASALRAARVLTGEARTISAACAVGMVGFLLHNVVDYAWHVTATGMAFWVLAGLVGAAWRQTDGEELRDGCQVSPKRRVSMPSRGRWFAGVCTILAACLLAVPAGLFLGAQALAASGDYTGAARLDPLNDVYRRQMALIAHQQARPSTPALYERAISEWHAVARLRPTYPGVHYNLGRIEEERGRIEQALAEYRRAQDLAPTWTDALVAEARLLQATGSSEQALSVWKRLDALSRSPLFRYRAVADDLDPNFSRAWLAIGDSLPADKAAAWYVRAAKYLREVMAANRRMEGVWRHSGEWERRQSSELVELATQVAERHRTFKNPGPRLRAALLLVDAGQEQRAKELFPSNKASPAERQLFGRVIDLWAAYVSASHLMAQGNFEAARELIRSRGPQFFELQGLDIGLLTHGLYHWSKAELDSLAEPARLAKRLASDERVAE